MTDCWRWWRKRRKKCRARENVVCQWQLTKLLCSDEMLRNRCQCEHEDGNRCQCEHEDENRYFPSRKKLWYETLSGEIKKRKKTESKYCINDYNGRVVVTIWNVIFSRELKWFLIMMKPQIRRTIDFDLDEQDFSTFRLPNMIDG